MEIQTLFYPKDYIMNTSIICPEKKFSTVSSSNFSLTFVLILVGFFLSPAVAVGQDKTSFEVKPKFISGDSFSDFAIGVSYNFAYRNSSSTIVKTAYGEIEPTVQAKAQGTVVSDRDLNNEALITQAQVGFSFLAGQANIDDLSIETDTGDLPTDKGDWAYFDFLAIGRHETDQAFQEQNLTLGAEAGYFNIQVVGPKSFIPSLTVAYEYVHPLESDIRNDLNLEKSDHSRFRFETSLKCWVGQFLTIKSLEPLHLHIDFRYYLSNDLDSALEQRSLDEVTYTSAALSYKSGKNQGPLSNITYFLKYADGRIPPNTENDSTISLGIVFPLGQQ